jgi:hypothetical protein
MQQISSWSCDEKKSLSPLVSEVAKLQLKPEPWN